ncbi:MAG: LON peptidase substrate-binding domain-containing protein [Acidobacteria bacterium]|nr:LON peptidase substrate-binding domain-containing protein [Acidobacteriota bacterium]
MKSERIPLFPLEVVLFPGTPLPLHIFEPRYKLMIRRCLENQAPFGVVLARSAGLAKVGCTAEIVKIMKKHEDGRMDILTMGVDPFRVIQVLEEQAYLEGAVELLEDDTRPAPAETRQRLLALYKQCHALIFGREPQSREIKLGESLAFQIASELPLELECKQELLELRTEAERQSRLLERLGEWRPQLTHLERVRGKAAGNGHGLH